MTRKVGRPVEKDPHNKVLRTRVNETLYNDIHAIADETDERISEVLRMAIAYYVKAYKRRPKQ